MWDPTTVLDFMSRSGANSDLNLATLSQKLVTSIALATLFQVSEIASISKDSVVFSNDGVSFSLSRLRKTQRSGGFQSFNLRRINDPLICPVECLGHYVFRSDFLRNANNQSKLFIGLRKPHKEVSGSTIVRWFKNYLSLAGVNSLIFFRPFNAGGRFQGGIFRCPHRLHFCDSKLVQSVHFCTILSSSPRRSYGGWGRL
jgi:hypothetical protein